MLSPVSFVLIHDKRNITLYTAPSMIRVTSYLQHKTWRGRAFLLRCRRGGLASLVLHWETVKFKHITKRSQAQLITSQAQPSQCTLFSRLVVMSDSSGSVDTRGCWCWCWSWCRGRSGRKASVLVPLMGLLRVFTAAHKVEIVRLWPCVTSIL